MSTATDTSTFAGIAAAWEENVPCMMEGGCNRKVAWHADQHGCCEGPICDYHISVFLESVSLDIMVQGAIRCMRCLEVFSELDKFICVRRI